MGGRPLRCGYEPALSDPSCSDCRPRLRSPRVHASVRGQRGAANMMLVQCNSDVPISLACSMWIGTVRTTASSEPRPWGDLEGLLSGRQRLGTQVFRPQVAPSCPTGSRCHRPTSYEGSHRRAGWVATTLSPMKRAGKRRTKKTPLPNRSGVLNQASQAKCYLLVERVRVGLGGGLQGAHALHRNHIKTYFISNS